MSTAPPATGQPQSGAVPLHVAWTQFQRRQSSMAEMVPLECAFLARHGKRHAAATLLDYGRLFTDTMSLLTARQPSVLWMQLPPLPLLWAGLWYRRSRDPAVRLVADCHNATFGARWGRVPFGLRMLDACDLVIVHNEDMRRQALSRGLAASRLFVLEDVPPLPVTRGSVALPDDLANRPRPWILMPGSFAADEPVGELLQAARLEPGWTFVLTGRHENAARHGHRLEQVPSNVVLPGYVDTPVFDAMMQASDLVLALTRQDGIQLSACNEALGFGKALIVSDTPLLRRLFADGARMADSSDPQSLVRAIAGALADRPALEQAARDLAAVRRTRWRQRMEEAPPWLNTPR